MQWISLEEKARPSPQKGIVIKPRTSTRVHRSKGAEYHCIGLRPKTRRSHKKRALKERDFSWKKVHALVLNLPPRWDVGELVGPFKA